MHSIGRPIKSLLCSVLCQGKALRGKILWLQLILHKMEEGSAHCVKRVFFFYIYIWRRRDNPAGDVKCKCHQGRACESRAAEIVVIYLNICFCMACCFCSPEDMQRRGMWQTDGAGGLAEPLRPSSPPLSSSSLSTRVVLDLSRLHESLMK